MELGCTVEEMGTCDILVVCCEVDGSLVELVVVLVEFRVEKEMLGTCVEVDVASVVLEED